MKTIIKTKSFYTWCIENDYIEIINRWDYDKNIISPKEISYRSNKKFYFKCPRELHESKPFMLSNITKPDRKTRVVLRCDKCESIGQYLVDNFGESGINNYWSTKNNVDPFLIPKGTAKKYYIKCQKNREHSDYLTTMNNFINGNRRPYCNSKIIYYKDSFGYWAENNIDNFKNKYWDLSNHVDYYELSTQTKQKIKIKCQEKTYHGVYEISCDNFYKGRRCPYCAGKKTHKYDSFGYKYPDLLKFWKYEMGSPYEILPMSNKKVTFNCEKHGDFTMIMCDFTESYYHCPKCAEDSKISSYEQMVQNYLNDKNIKFLTEYDCNISPINPKTGRMLPYDNELIDYKIIIEVNGAQHYQNKTIWFGKTEEEQKYHFEYQKWKDQYKKEYAIKKGYKFLELPYWMFNDDTYIKEMEKVINNTPTTTK